MATFEDTLSQVHAAIGALPADASTLSGLTDQELTALPAGLAAARHRLEAREAQVAGEIARRSTFDLGYAGLAQKTGFRTPEKLIQHLTGSTGREASKLVRTGVIIHEAELLSKAERTGQASPELTHPWLAPVGRAVTTGMISMEAGEAIRLGLGTPTVDIPADALSGAAARLVELGVTGTDPDSPHPAGTNAVPLNANQ